MLKRQTIDMIGMDKLWDDRFKFWFTNQPLLGGFNGIRDIANKAGIKFPQTQKELIIKIFPFTYGKAGYVSAIEALLL